MIIYNGRVFLDQLKTLELIDGWFEKAGQFYSIDSKKGVVEHKGNRQEILIKIKEQNESRNKI